MATIYFVSCVKKKLTHCARAKDLYTSPWFRKASKIAQRDGDQWYILSAKHGLLEPDEEVAPYDATLRAMSRAERCQWAKGVVDDIVARSHPSDHLIFLAIASYRENVVPLLRGRGYQWIEEPLEGLRRFEQGPWLAHQLSGSDRDRRLT